MGRGVIITLDAHIQGLQRNIARLRQRLVEMQGNDYRPPNACCPSCYWGSELDEVAEAWMRRDQYLKVLVCRKMGGRPQKVRMIKYRDPGTCGACGGSGRTTKFSVGLCRCGDSDCPGRGLCHACKGTGASQRTKTVVVRDWPEGFK